MRITHLSLDGQGAWPDLEVDSLPPQLNVFYGPPQSGKSTLAELMGQLLYGKSSSAWRPQLGQSLVAGSLTVVDPVAAPASSQTSTQTPPSYVLRRDYDTSADALRRSAIGDSPKQYRLTIAASDGSPVDGETMQALLAGLQPAVARQLYAIDFSETPPLSWLLSENFARQFSHPLHSQSPASVDRRRIDELMTQRDTIAQQLQTQVGVRCQESQLLERELADAETTLEDHRHRHEQLRGEQQTLATQRVEVESRLRYATLEIRTEHPANPPSPQQQQRLAELDAEIARCRGDLNHQQSQANSARAALAQIAPDGTADSVTCLEDGRASLHVLENLLDDLDLEISQLHQADRPPENLRARLQPVTQRMRQQIYTLCGQLSAQQHKTLRQQLVTEIQQLERIQTGLSERLEQLHARREALLRPQELATVAGTPQPPVADACQCQHHSTFLDQLATAGPHHVDQLRQQLSHLRAQDTALADELAALQQKIEHLQTHAKRLQAERAQLLGGGTIKHQQTELRRLEEIIQALLQQTPAHTSHTGSAPGTASQLLARFSGGELTQIRLQRDTSDAPPQQLTRIRGCRPHANRGEPCGAATQPCLAVKNRHGRLLALENLSTAQQDQLYLALTLALIGSHARQGIRLPLLLDEPFLRQNESGTAAMALVLDEFSRAGHQVFVFTEDRSAMRRLAARGAAIHELDALRGLRSTTAKTSPPAAPAPRTRLVRQTDDGRTVPALRLADVTGNDPEDVFYLHEDSPWELFPVLGHTTQTLFDQIGIHTVGDLLLANPKQVARQLDRPQIHPSTVRLWQYHMGLMCHIPALTLRDVQLLTSVNIYTPEDLVAADLETLWPAIEEFLTSDRGRQLISDSQPYSRNQLSHWQQKARDYRNRWQHARYPSWQTRPTASGKTSARKPEAAQAASRPTPRTWKFLLDLTDDVEAAPSIGPKTAQRLAQIGIRSVADFLSADPENTAAELDTNQIPAKTITTWQHQARLVCQIPSLPGYGAQLLVANGFISPAQIAQAKPAELVNKILAFCNTKAGQRILRSGDAPARDKIANWVEYAAHHRPLGQGGTATDHSEGGTATDHSELPLGK